MSLAVLLMWGYRFGKRWRRDWLSGNWLMAVGLLTPGLPHIRDGTGTTYRLRCNTAGG